MLVCRYLFGYVAVTDQDIEEVFRAPQSSPTSEGEGTRKVLLGKPAAKFGQKSLKVVYTLRFAHF
jgi:hypothetical protein